MVAAAVAVAAGPAGPGADAVPQPDPLLTAQEIDALPERRHVHQFNDNGVRHTRSIGDLVGMTHLGVHLVRLEPGRDSTQFHFHHQDEEFLYILEGRAMASLGDEEREVGPGDFMGFTAPSVPHKLHNPFDEDVVYLMCGERNQIDVCDYPAIGKRMYRVDGAKEAVDQQYLEPVGKPGNKPDPNLSNAR